MREPERLAALARYDILDTPSEEAFDRITRLTRKIFDVPMSTITLIDGHRQWFKARSGVAACETARGPAFCDVAVREGRPLIVPDTLQDQRFATNPFVVGEPRIRFYAGVPLQTAEGHAIGTLCAMDTRPRRFRDNQAEILADLAQIVMSELELRRLAMTDALTGTLSRRAFREEFSRAFALARRHRHDLSCIMVDLDYFKSVNDQHGHAVGDVVLVEATAALREALRKSDAFGRMGGEEFAALLPHTGPASAMQVAEKLRAAITRVRVSTLAGPLQITASFGVATLDSATVEMDGLLENADAALYAAKDAGRNRCHAWRPVAMVRPDNPRRVLKGGLISFDGGRSCLDCSVRSLSEESASLKVISTSGVPETFTLVIEADGLSRDCQIVGKAEQRLDVAFV